ncbi:hypothetical protein ACHAWF_008578 [Thalassiosira exigua]
MAPPLAAMRSFAAVVALLALRTCSRSAATVARRRTPPSASSSAAGLFVPTPPSHGAPPWPSLVPPRARRRRPGARAGVALAVLSDGGRDGGAERDGDAGRSNRTPPPSASAEQAQAETTRRAFLRRKALAAAASSLLPPAASSAATAASSDLSSAADNGYFSLRNNNNVPDAQRRQLVQQRKSQLQERADRRKRAASPLRLKRWTPFANREKWKDVETCLLEMLPVRNPVFRQLQDLIEELEAFPPGDGEGWKQTLLDALNVLAVLSSKRNSLEPAFNQDDSTELYISKSSLGERNIEKLRDRIEEVVAIAAGDADVEELLGGGRETVNRPGRRRRTSGRGQAQNGVEDVNVDFAAGEIDVDAFSEAKRQALLALSELGELLVPSFPYAVPTRGKFGYLPRLLGRCTVTFSFERPSSPASALGLKFGGLGNFGNLGGIGTIGGGNKVLGNVTIVADGYAAPITAGNFVDLSQRQFYTGLPVRAVRKRLGLVPTWSDNVVLNDLTELRDNLDELRDAAAELPETLREVREKGGGGRKAGGVRSLFRPPGATDESAFDGRDVATTDANLPVLGSFEEGFYDPLTAQPRRIPLEVVALDAASPTRSALTYSSTYAALDDDLASPGGGGSGSGAGGGAAKGKGGTTTYSALISTGSAQRSFSSATSSSSSNSTAATYRDLDPVLSFDIPDLVALNHPDRASNGGSSEFFALPRRDVSSRRSKLLDGQYAPFGYIVEGSDVYQGLRPGDVIGATYVSEVGLLNLVKIRKNAFEGEEEEEGADATGGAGEAEGG